jgi:hypothetical protein
LDIKKDFFCNIFIFLNGFCDFMIPKQMRLIIVVNLYGLIWWSLNVYMVINFRAREISQYTHKLTRTSMLMKKNSSELLFYNFTEINYK